MFALQLDNDHTNTSVYQRLAINQCMKLNKEYAKNPNREEEWLKLSNFITSPVIKMLKTSEEEIEWYELKKKIIITKTSEENGEVTKVTIEHTNCTLK